MGEKNQARLDLLEELAKIAANSKYPDEMKITRVQAMIFGGMVLSHITKMREVNGEEWFIQVFNGHSYGQHWKKPYKKQNYIDDKPRA